MLLVQKILIAAKLCAELILYYFLAFQKTSALARCALQDCVSARASVRALFLKDVHLKKVTGEERVFYERRSLFAHSVNVQHHFTVRNK